MIDLALIGIAAGQGLLAAAIVLAWLVASAHWLRPRQGRSPAGAEILIAHASQTGTAQQLARLAKRQIDAQGQPAALLPLGTITREHLAGARRLVIVASTTGAGEAPDPARRFEQELMPAPLSLPDLEVFILALGDRSYAEFCAFGLRLGEWAARIGARVSLVPVDNHSPEDFARWDALMRANNLPQIGAARSGTGSTWIIQSRELVADGDTRPIAVSRSGGLYHLTLVPAEGGFPDFAVGDLFEWHGDDGVRRDFSIASLPAATAIELFIRRVELPGGGMGRASAILTGADGPIRVQGQIRSFSNFHATSGKGPLLAIAAGSGWGGIRPHILHAIAQGRPVWLIYGERGPNTDSALFSEMRAWQTQGAISRLDVVLSRAETGMLRHVQDSVIQAGARLAEFLGDDGAVVMCGAMAMGDSVNVAMARLLGDAWIAQARHSDRWRAALY